MHATLRITIEQSMMGTTSSKKIHYHLYFYLNI